MTSPPKTNTVAEGLAERTWYMSDETASNIDHFEDNGDLWGKNKTLTKVEQSENIHKNNQILREK